MFFTRSQTCSFNMSPLIRLFPEAVREELGFLFLKLVLNENIEVVGSSPPSEVTNHHHQQNQRQDETAGKDHRGDVGGKHLPESPAFSIRSGFQNNWWRIPLWKRAAFWCCVYVLIRPGCTLSSWPDQLQRTLGNVVSGGLHA